MSYLLDKKIKQRKLSFGIFFFIVILFLFYFRAGIFKGFSAVSHTIFYPVLALGNNIGEKFSNLGVYFTSKNSLDLENHNLKLQLSADATTMANYNTLLNENLDLKNMLVRKSIKEPMILGSILSKPNQSPYDTIIIDLGKESGIKVGDTVFAFGDVPIGRVADVYMSSANVVLFSTSGEKTEVVTSVKNVYLEMVGRGGGNFEIILPKDFTLQAGDQVVLPGITPYVVAKVETIISDPRDSFIKALLSSPVNIQELKFVQVSI